MKSFLTFLANYYQRNHSKQYLQTFIRESFQTLDIRTYYYRSNHSKQVLQTTTRDIMANRTYKLLAENHSQQYLKATIREIIPNNTYKLLPEKSLQIILTKVYQRIQFIPNNTSYLWHIIQKILLKLLSENSLQTMLSSLVWILQQVKSRVTLHSKTQILVLIINNCIKVSNYGEHTRFLVKHYNNQRFVGEQLKAKYIKYTHDTKKYAN